MLRTAVDERRHPRIVAAHHRFPEGRPGHPLIVNASQGGACLWFGSRPAESQSLTLRFTSHGHDRELRSRIVWSRPCAATTSPASLKRAVGWLAGVAFMQPESGADVGDIPNELLREGHVTVSFDRDQPGPHEQDQAPAQEANAQGIIVLDEKSMHGIKAATHDLMPLFARHLSDIHVVLKQQQLEIKASFREPGNAAPPQNDSPKTQTHDAAQSVAVPARIAREKGYGKTEGFFFNESRRRALITISGVAVVAVAVGYKSIWSSRNHVRDQVGASAPQAQAPIRASAVGAALTADWIEVKSAFGLSDATVRAAIDLLQHNDIYPPAHDLYDLAKYPRQVGRAFSLIGSGNEADTGMPALGKLKNDLESRLIAGARFPDEPAGGRYSSLQRELYNNVVVLGVVDLLYRQRDDPAVKQLLATIMSTATSNPKTLASAPAADRATGSK